MDGTVYGRVDGFVNVVSYHVGNNRKTLSNAIRSIRVSHGLEVSEIYQPMPRRPSGGYSLHPDSAIRKAGISRALRLLIS